MKKFVLILFAIFSTTIIYSQDFIKKSTIPIDDNIRKIMATRIAVVDYQIIDLDLSQIQSKDFFVLDFFNHHITLKKERVEIRGTNKYTLFLTDNSKLNQSIITVHNTDIQGLITADNEIYRIETLFDKVLVTKIDQSKYPPEDCKSFENLPQLRDSITYYRKKEDNNYKLNERKLFKTYPEQEFWNYQCKLRILVLYTTAAKNAKSNIENHIQLAIDEMNQSFVNSSVNFQVELVHIEESNYQESNSPTLDLKRFTLNNDGHMDNIHVLRERYSADVCVLIGDIDSVCGKAAAIKSCEEKSFCIINWNCATGNFTFAHEIGHLIGTRHDPNADPNTNPYAYGHGFIGPNNGWRTIMGLGVSCNNCPRIQWWSNPNVTRNGQAMGTTQSHDNARLLNTYIPNIMSHRPHTGSRVVTQADIVDSVGVIYHANKIETSGNLIIPNGYSWGFIAVNEVTLNTGFVTELGSLFEARLEAICGSPDNEACNFSTSFDENISREIKNADVNQIFKVFPIPTYSNELTIQCKLAEIPNNYFMEVYNSLGQLIFKQGIYSIRQVIKLPVFAQGVYTLSIRHSSLTIQNIKIIIK